MSVWGSSRNASRCSETLVACIPHQQLTTELKILWNFVRRFENIKHMYQDRSRRSPGPSSLAQFVSSGFSSVQGKSVCGYQAHHSRIGRRRGEAVYPTKSVYPRREELLRSSVRCSPSLQQRLPYRTNLWRGWGAGRRRASGRGRSHRVDWRPKESRLSHHVTTNNRSSCVK